MTKHSAAKDLHFSWRFYARNKQLEKQPDKGKNTSNTIVLEQLRLKQLNLT
jgi:hypothetical protein